MAYYLDQMLTQVKSQSQQLADELNTYLTIPDFSNYHFFMDGEEQGDSEFLCKCLACIIQCANPSSMVYVYFHHIDSRFFVEISFRTGLGNSATFEEILDKLRQLAPPHIHLNFSYKSDAPSTLAIDIGLAGYH